VQLVGCGPVLDERAMAEERLLERPAAVPMPHGGTERRVARHRRRTLTFAAVDAAMLLLAVLASALGAAQGGLQPAPIAVAVLFGVLTLLLIAGRGGYRFRLETSPLDHTAHVLGAGSVAAMAIIAATVIHGGDAAESEPIIRLWAFAAVYLFAGRLAVGLATHRANRRGIKTLIIGAGTVGHTVARRLVEHREMGLEPVGFLDHEPRDVEGAVDLPVLGASWDLGRVVHRHEVDHVIVTFSTAPHAVVLGIIRRCRDLGVQVSLVPRLFEEVSNRISVEHLGGIPLLHVGQADPRGWQFDVKYALDRLLGCLAVVWFAPVLLVIGALVKLSSPGPVLFGQRRVGLDGREFDMLKFRTMRLAPPGIENDAAWMARAIGGEEGAEVVATADRRTPLGTFLRRWSLDELPQVINVVRGDMSLVGPRPERAGYVETFRHHVYRYGDRHRVKSGITGWAQVNGLRGETSLTDRVEWDNYSVENWTPWLDLKILVMTPLAVLSGRGAQ
jgi:exopolysaccharide biosynthesis polyprenyl glycosylphosphotransferase